MFGEHKSFLWRHWLPCFGHLVMSARGFKARVDPSLVCLTACMQWIPQIHLWCNMYPRALVRVRTHDQSSVPQHSALNRLDTKNWPKCPREPTTNRVYRSTVLLTVWTLKIDQSVPDSHRWPSNRWEWVIATTEDTDSRLFVSCESTLAKFLLCWKFFSTNASHNKFIHSLLTQMYVSSLVPIDLFVHSQQKIM